jgi:hypothetical protein
MEERKRITAKDIVEMINTIGSEKFIFSLFRTEKFSILTLFDTNNIIRFVKEHPEEFEEKVIRPEFVYIAFKSMSNHPVIVKYDVADPECKIICWKGEEFEYIETPFKVKDFYQYDEYFSEVDCVEKVIEYIFGLKPTYSDILRTSGELFCIPFKPYDITNFIVGEYEDYLFEKEKQSKIQSIGRSFRKGGE